MAHGSKKWIRTFDGRIKRSNDRTKKDKYGGLKYWKEMDNGGHWNRRYGFYDVTVEPRNFCPQCKHVQKPILKEEDDNRTWRKELEAEYYRTYGDTLREWEEYKKQRDITWTDHEGHIHYKDVPKPLAPEPPNFYKWKLSRGSGMWGWQYNTRSYLCYKHERWYNIKWSDEYMTDTYGRFHIGRKSITHARRAEYKMYRTKTKNLMQRAKYDESYYDDIVPKKRGWLD
jgi:hypothetical protein